MAPMKDEELDSIIERARARRDSHGTLPPDSDSVWNRIHGERKRISARNTFLRRGAGIVAVAVVVVGGTSMFFHVGPSWDGGVLSGIGGGAGNARDFAIVNLIPAHAEPNFQLRTAVA